MLGWFASPSRESMYSLTARFVPLPIHLFISLRATCKYMSPAKFCNEFRTVVGVPICMCETDRTVLALGQDRTDGLDEINDQNGLPFVSDDPTKKN